MSTASPSGWQDPEDARTAGLPPVLAGGAAAQVATASGAAASATDTPPGAIRSAQLVVAPPSTGAKVTPLPNLLAWALDEQQQLTAVERFSQLG